MADSDRVVLIAAYEESLKVLFSTFFASYTAALGDPEREAEAETRFQRGVVHARYVRDRALALLP